MTDPVVPPTDPVPVPQPPGERPAWAVLYGSFLRLPLVWSCKVCGPTRGSSGTWCDAGCGSDYQEMTPYVDALAAAHLAAAPGVSQ